MIWFFELRCSYIRNDSRRLTDKHAHWRWWISDALWIGVSSSEYKCHAGPLTTGNFVASVCVLIYAIRVAVDNPKALAKVRWIESDTGRTATAGVDCPASQERTGYIVLKDLVRRPVVDNPQVHSVGHEILGVAVAAIQVEAACCGLATGESTSGASVLEDLVLLVIDEPDVGTVGAIWLWRTDRRLVLNAQPTSTTQPKENLERRGGQPNRWNRRLER